MKVSYLKELDGVRGVAALMVMFYHFFFRIKSDNLFMQWIVKITHFGQSGVSLFFVLSGFLITRILLSTKQNEFYFSHFYWRRSFRIFPLYFLFLAVHYFVLPIIRHEPMDSFALQAPYWFYLQDFALTFNWPADGPTYFWSLAVEEHFYLFWPLLVYFFDNKKIVYSIFFIMLLAIVTRFLLIDNNYEYRYFTFSRMDELAIGALLAIMEVKGKLSQGKQNKRVFSIFFMVTAVPVLMFWSSLTNDSPSHILLDLTKYLILGLFYFSFIGFVVTSAPHTYLKKILRNRILLFSGKTSYGLYVYHPVCFWAVTQFFKTDNLILKLIAAFGVSFIVASASFYLFEKPFLGLKKYFEYKGPKNKAATTQQMASVVESTDK